MSFLKSHRCIINKIIARICNVSRNQALKIIHSLIRSNKMNKVEKLDVKYIN